MKKYRIVSVLIIVTMFVSLFNIVTYASGVYDYRKIYLDYATDADNNYDNKLNDAINGIILIDLNRDEIPELLAFSATLSRFDENGNQIYLGEEGYDNPAYEEESYNIEKAFSIIDGELVEDSPWIFEEKGEYTDGFLLKHEKTAKMIPMPYLPDEEVIDTEEFCVTVQREDGKDCLAMFDNFKYSSGIISIWYDGERFGCWGDEFDYDFFDTRPIVDLPVASIQFNKRKKSEVMNILLDKYENVAKNATYSPVYAYEYGSAGDDWTTDEVNEAMELGIIPQEMLNDDLTENVTRAEFAAIAMHLHRAISGEEFNWHGGYIVDIDDNIYQTYVRGAYIYGITKGTGVQDGGIVFSPDLNITREQLATMLCRVVKINKLGKWFWENGSDLPLDISNTRKFNDDYQISNYANEAVYYLSKHGAINGVDNFNFAPLDFATKEQAIVLALRIYNAFEELPMP